MRIDKGPTVLTIITNNQARMPLWTERRTYPRQSCRPSLEKMLIAMLLKADKDKELKEVCPMHKPRIWIKTWPLTNSWFQVLKASNKDQASLSTDTTLSVWSTSRRNLCHLLRSSFNRSTAVKDSEAIRHRCHIHKFSARTSQWCSITPTIWWRLRICATEQVLSPTVSSLALCTQWAELRIKANSQVSLTLEQTECNNNSSSSFLIARIRTHQSPIRTSRDTTLRKDKE